MAIALNILVYYSKLMTNIAINGFGRIGRLLLRVLLDKGIGVVAVNSTSDAKTKAHLFKYDTVYGAYPKKVEAGKDYIKVGGKKIVSLMERNPEALPWKKLDVDLVVESTGIFTKRKDAAMHLKAGANRVIISAPSKDADKTFCYGVNEKEYDKKKHKIVSNASCTTNALVPMAKILNDKFGIIKGFMTTIHGVTASQNLVDGSHKDMRRARSAIGNIIPTTTGATVATELVLPELKGKLEGMAFRVPVLAGSIVDLNVQLKKKVTIDEINKEFRKAAVGKFKGVVDVTDEPIVSSDIIGNSHACVVDLMSTKVNGNMAKILGWYDNEWGYTNQLARKIISMVKK